MSRRSFVPVALCWLGVGALAALVSQSLLGLPPQGHDTLLHFYRIPVINALWARGVPYSRWLPDLFFGYGSPLLNFYPPLSAYLLTITYWAVGANAPVALNAAFALTLIVAAVGMFALGRLLYGNLGGLFAAAAYALSPHLLYQTFARSSISDALAMSLLPLAVLTMLRVVQQPTARRMALAAIACAAVLLSHTATSLLFAPPLAFMAAAVAWTSAPAKRRATRLLAVGGALALGTALAAFAWLPAVTELQYTRYDMVTGPDKIDFRENLGQIWESPTTTIDGLVNAPLAKTVGAVQFALASLGLGIALASLAKRRSLVQKAQGPSTVLAVLAGLIGVGAVFMATSASSWLWANSSLLRVLQFPWRWLQVGAFFVALTCGYLALVLTRRQWPGVALLAVALLVFFVSAVPYLYPPRMKWLPQQPTLADVTWAQERYGIYGLTSWGEYTTREVPASSWPLQPPFPGADLGATLDAKLERASLPADALLSASGDPWQATLQLSLTSEALVVFDCHYFPGWAATIDGRSAPVVPDEQGRLSLAVPAGQHVAWVGFGRTPIRWAADVASLIGAIMIAAGIAWPRRPRAVVPPELKPQPMVEERADSARGGIGALVGVLIALALAKFLWLDQTNSLLVVHPAEGQIPGIAVPTYGDFQGIIRLVGCDAKSPDQLTLYWQATQAPTQNYEMVVTVVDSHGAVAKEVVNAYPGHNCTSNWAEGQLTRDEYTLPVDASWPAGTYQLSVGVRDSKNGELLALADSPGGGETQAGVGAIELRK